MQVVGPTSVNEMPGSESTQGIDAAVAVIPTRLL